MARSTRGGATRYATPAPQLASHSLTNVGQQDGALLLVLVAEVLAVTLLLLPSPAVHLKSTNKSEDQDAQVQLTDQEDTQPSEDLEHVVGAGNQVEAEARRNSTLGSSRTTQVTQNIVRVQVGQLAEDEQGQARPYKQRVGLRGCGCGIGSGNPVGNVETGKEPVVGAVLEDVENGHGGAAESVHEDGFKLALQEVQSQQAAYEQLQVGGVGEGLVEVEVYVRTEGE